MKKLLSLTNNEVYLKCHLHFSFSDTCGSDRLNLIIVAVYMRFGLIRSSVLFFFRRNCLLADLLTDHYHYHCKIVPYQLIYFMYVLF